MEELLCNITSIKPECKHDFIQGLGYSFVFLLGFFVNAAALWAFISNRRSWTDTHVYMLNLVIADSALVICLPVRIYDAFQCVPRSKWCTFLIFLHYINMYASMMTMVAISIQRYVVIRFPLQSHAWGKKKETAFAVCLMIWVLLVAVCYIYREENYPIRLWTCYERCKNVPLHLTFVLIVVLMGFLLPLLTITFCSSRIICILSNDETEQKRRTVGIVKANLIVFIICYTPIHFAFIVNLVNVPEDDKWVNNSLPQHKYLLVSEWIASTNCCFDFISYYFLLRSFYS